MDRGYAVPADADPFPYVGAVAVLLWAFIVVSAVELVVLHAILPWETIRLLVDVASLWGLGWMLGLAASYHVYPHVMTTDGLRIRNGSRIDVLLPWDQVARIAARERGRDSSKAVQLDHSEEAASP